MSQFFKIMIDADGVCADFVDGVVKKYNQLFPFRDKVTRNDATNYRFDSFLRGNELVDIMNLPNFFLDLDIMPGVIENLKQIVSRGHDIRFVTKLPIIKDNNGDYNKITLKASDDKLLWFDKNIFSQIRSLSSRNLVFVFDKTWLNDNFDVIFEDYVDQLIELSGVRVLFDAPYNRHFMDGTIVDDDRYSIYRVGKDMNLAWKEFNEIIAVMER